MHKPIVLIVLDGWGISKNPQGNIFSQAVLPTIEKLEKYYPQTALQASGISVGLPWGEMGNSEVGHMALGAGRIIYQNLPRITLSIRDKSFFQNEALLAAVNHVKQNNSALHLLGLVSDGAVHSHIDHLLALLELAQQHDIRSVFIHAITDGRDTSPTSGVGFLKIITNRINDLGVGVIATISGRYYAMDRNNNWDRTSAAYENMTTDACSAPIDPISYVEQSYAEEVTDEFIKPASFAGPQGTVKNNDALIFFNFREDRARQITKAFILPEFSEFPHTFIENFRFTGMIQYEDNLPMSVAFLPIAITSTLGEILSIHSKKQLRIAETEKYAHVTYFFNGGREEPFLGEKRILLPSKPVSSFDKLPEMSAREITDALLKGVAEASYDFILVNYANTDMVGHTGNLEAGIKAAEAVDAILGEAVTAILSSGGCALITADHGNAEEMTNERTGQVDTEHSINPVPLWFLSPINHREKTSEEIEREKFTVNGMLADVAPTILDLMKVQKPPEMTGTSLLPMLN